MGPRLKQAMAVAEGSARALLADQSPKKSANSTCLICLCLNDGGGRVSIVIICRHTPSIREFNPCHWNAYPGHSMGVRSTGNTDLISWIQQKWNFMLGPWGRSMWVLKPRMRSKSWPDWSSMAPWLGCWAKIAIFNIFDLFLVFVQTKWKLLQMSSAELPGRPILRAIGVSEISRAKTNIKPKHLKLGLYLTGNIPGWINLL